MDTEFMKKVEQKYVKREPDIKPGDTVKVSLRIVEAGKERIQIFEGVVIALKGTGTNKSMTVRKISSGVGVEKILPLNSPTISQIDIVKRGSVRRSKLFYMRDKIGKRSLDAGFDENFETMTVEDYVQPEDKKEAEKSADVESEGSDVAVDTEDTKEKEEVKETKPETPKEDVKKDSTEDSESKK